MRILVQWLLIVSVSLILTACDAGAPTPDGESDSVPVSADETLAIVESPATATPDTPPTPVRTAAPTATPFFGRDVPTGRSSATLRVIHAAHGAPTLDVRLDGSSIASSLGYGLASGLTATLPGTYTLSIIQRGTDTILAQSEVTLTAMVTTDVVVVADDERLTLTILDGATEPINDGLGTIRAVHAVRGLGDIGLTLNGSSAGGTIALGEATGINEQPEGDITATFSTGRDELISNIVRLRAYNSALLVVAGAADRPHLLVFEAPLLGRYSLRIINLSTDAREIDIYFDDALVAGNLASRASTESAVYSTAEATLSVYTAFADLNISIPFISGHRIMPRAGTTVTLAIHGPVADLRAMWIEEDVSPVPAQRARVTFAHVTPDVQTVRMAINGEDIPELRPFGYSQHSESRLFPEVPVRLSARDGARQESTFEMHDGVTFASGKSYLFFVTGSIEAPVILETPVETDPNLIADPAATPAGIYNARFVNAIYDQPTVDVLINGQRAATSLRYAESNTMQQLPDSSVQVTVQMAGAGGAVLFEGEVALLHPASYTLFISGTPEQGYAITPIEDIGLAVGMSAGTVRFVNLNRDPFLRFGVATQAVIQTENPTATPIPTATAEGNTVRTRPSLQNNMNMLFRSISANSASRAVGVVANSILYIANENQEITAFIGVPQPFAQGTHTDIVYYEYPTGETSNTMAFTIVYTP